MSNTYYILGTKVHVNTNQYGTVYGSIVDIMLDSKGEYNYTINGITGYGHEVTVYSIQAFQIS